jgi:phage N-6-adenine-methyltransferase
MTQFKQEFVDEKNVNIRNYWETPRWIVNELEKVFAFTVDAAANKGNRKFPRYFDEADNGLEQSWEGEVVFCNPPHSKGAYGAWVDKAQIEFLNSGVTSVLVLPYNWETKGFSGVREAASYLVMPHKRIKYDAPAGIDGSSPTFYSCIVVFSFETLSDKQIDILFNIGHVIDLGAGMLTR